MEILKTSRLQIMKALKKFLFNIVAFLVFLGFLFPALGEAQTTVTINGQRFTSTARVVARDKTVYIAVEDLFKEIGGIAYYSPIMKKVNLKLGRISFVLSLDKGVAVSEDKEIPLNGNVFVEDNKVYVALSFLAELFGFKVSTRGEEVPSPSPKEVVPSPRLLVPLLSGVRFASYDTEMRTRITFDFRGRVPSFSSQVDRTQNTVRILFRNCNLGDVPETTSVNDTRIKEITLKKQNGQIEAIISFKEPVQLREGKLEGENPRAYFDLVSLVEVTTASTFPPGPSPLPSPSLGTPSPLPSPLLVSPSPEIINPKAVVLDPGHGGKDPGCIHNGHEEKAIVLQIAKKVKGLLETRGYEVYMTRNDDTYPSLDDRYNLANSKNPFVFVSIHCNACPNPKADGVEAFLGGAKPRGEGALDVANRENASFGREEVEKRLNPQKLNSVYTSAYYGKSREASAELGRLLLDKISSATGQTSRGLKEAPLVVLGHMYYPACLVEVGFLSNPNEAKKLASSSFQDRIAKGIAEAIEAFAKSPVLEKLLKGD